MPSTSTNIVTKRPTFTKTACKRLIGAMQDMGVEKYEIVIEGAAMRVIIGGDDNALNDVANLIDGVA